MAEQLAGGGGGGDFLVMDGAAQPGQVVFYIGVGKEPRFLVLLPAENTSSPAPVFCAWRQTLPLSSGPCGGRRRFSQISLRPIFFQGAAGEYPGRPVGAGRGQDMQGGFIFPAGALGTHQVVAIGFY